MLTLLPTRASVLALKQTAVPCTDRVLRRGLDVGLSVLLLILSLPVLLPAALAIKLSSPGPVFYRQARVGRGGRLFSIWKLRTMKTAAEPGGPLVTAQDDARITPVGQRLRSWKLDELPQLFNVICGEMSLVGPRPQVPRFVDCFDPGLRRSVLSVRPGMTGLTALYFRHEEFLLSGQPDREQFYITQILPVKLQMEAAYVQSRSLKSDLKILADTLHLVLSRLAGRAGHSGVPAVSALSDLEATELRQQTAELAQMAEIARTA